MVDEAAIVAVLRTVYDPEIPVDIYDLGLVYGIEISEAGEVKVRMTLTSPNCPVAESLPVEVEEKVKTVPGVTACRVEIVFDPPWNPSLMSAVAKLKLNL